MDGDQVAVDNGAMDDGVLLTAGVIDRVAAMESPYAFLDELRSELGFLHPWEVPDDASPVSKAAFWAFGYEIEFTEENGRNRISLSPRHMFGEVYHPPKLSDIPDEIVEIWRGLQNAVKSAHAKARFSHILFELKVADKREQCLAAINAYFDSALGWASLLDSAMDLGAALRLSRAIGENGKRAEALNKLLDIADNVLKVEEPLAGVVYRALSYAITDPDCPDRIDELLETASNSWPDANRNDHAFEFMLQRKPSEEKRAEIWSRRVESYLAEAERESSPIVRSVRRERALELADKSGYPTLRNVAAVALQSVRNEQLDFMHFSAATSLFREEWEQLRDTFISDESWQKSLISFGCAGPLTGDFEVNRIFVSESNAQHPLASLFPVHVTGPDGLPVFKTSTSEEKFEYDLVQRELQFLRMNITPLDDAWMVIPQRFGMPGSAELSDFLGNFPGIPREIIRPLIRSMQRSWCGDDEGASYALMPRIEMQVRRLVIEADAGVYRLQREESPGQFPGLGSLIGTLVKYYDIDESRRRFLNAIFCYPGGMNMRNLMLHGFYSGDNEVAAPLLIHTVLMLGLLQKKTMPDE
ncbi:DUF4209 domain-containing protein [Nocardia arthritidis]|uniref:DUF4209 domain-containing protein n=1 Tax=Nocardia arthritidis TaxID=228602 RepID=A0A6G9YSE7_9NOCA|nr:DUF4209 domain-containing protein [Nocardia arthritidis]QIS15813.1 DUF4209 domain-containing protein [Nocardia arthritidis]